VQRKKTFFLCLSSNFALHPSIYNSNSAW